jgi:hypothetical protein
MIQKLMLCFAMTTLFAHAGASAAECKYEKNEIDKFTKAKVIETDWERLTTGAKFFATFSTYASVRVKGDETFLRVKFALTEHEKYRPRQYQLNNRFTIAEGSPLLLLLADGTLVELQTSRGAKVTAKYTDPKDMEYVEDFQIESAGEIQYTLDDASIAALTAQDVTNLRIAGVEKYTDPYSTRFDVSVREKMISSIRKALVCAK